MITTTVRNDIEKACVQALLIWQLPGTEVKLANGETVGIVKRDATGGVLYVLLNGGERFFESPSSLTVL